MWKKHDSLIQVLQKLTMILYWQTLMSDYRNFSIMFCDNLDMNINKNETKIIVLSKNENLSISITIGNEYLEVVNKYKYLGSCSHNLQWILCQDMKLLDIGK